MRAIALPLLLLVACGLLSVAAGCGDWGVILDAREEVRPPAGPATSSNGAGSVSSSSSSTTGVGGASATATTSSSTTGGMGGASSSSDVSTSASTGVPDSGPPPYDAGPPDAAPPRDSGPPPCNGPYQAVCDGECVDTSADVNNCGGCHVKCLGENERWSCAIGRGEAVPHCQLVATLCPVGTGTVGGPIGDGGTTWCPGGCLRFAPVSQFPLEIDGCACGADEEVSSDCALTGTCCAAGQTCAPIAQGYSVSICQ